MPFNPMPKRDFTIVPNHVIFEPRLTPNEKAVLLVLAGMATDKVYLAIWQLRDATGMPKAAVIKALQGLRELGVVKRWQGGVSSGKNYANTYHLQHPKLWNLASREHRANLGITDRERQKEWRKKPKQPVRGDESPPEPHY